MDKLSRDARDILQARAAIAATGCPLLAAAKLLKRRGWDAERVTRAIASAEKLNALGL